MIINQKENTGKDGLKAWESESPDVCLSEAVFTGGTAVSLSPNMSPLNSVTIVRQETLPPTAPPGPYLTLRRDAERMFRLVF